MCSWYRPQWDEKPTALQLGKPFPMEEGETTILDTLSIAFEKLEKNARARSEEEKKLGTIAKLKLEENGEEALVSLHAGERKVPALSYELEFVGIDLLDKCTFIIRKKL